MFYAWSARLKLCPFTKLQSSPPKPKAGFSGTTCLLAGCRPLGYGGGLMATQGLRPGLKCAAPPVLMCLRARLRRIASRLFCVQWASLSGARFGFPGGLARGQECPRHTGARAGTLAPTPDDSEMPPLPLARAAAHGSEWHWQISSLHAQGGLAWNSTSARGQECPRHTSFKRYRFFFVQ